MQNEEKRKAMDAVSHPETAQQRRLFSRGGRDAGLGGTVAVPRPAPARDSLLGEVKRQAMDAIRNVETVGQIGWMKVAGVAAVYTAHIRQVDRESMRQKEQTRHDPHQRRAYGERLGRE